VLHTGDEAMVVDLDDGDVGAAGDERVTDLWTGRQLSWAGGRLQLDVPAHGSRLLGLDPA